MRKRNEAEIMAAEQEITAREIEIGRLRREVGEISSFLEGAVDMMRLLLQATRVQPRPGIYFLLGERGSLLYVGQSENVAGRMAGHTGKQYHDVVMIHEPRAEERNRLERLLIHYLVPPLNVQLQAYNRAMELRATKRVEQKALDEQSMIDAGRFIEELEERHAKKAAARLLMEQR